MSNIFDAHSQGMDYGLPPIIDNISLYLMNHPLVLLGVVVIVVGVILRAPIVDKYGQDAGWNAARHTKNIEDELRRKK